MSHMVIFRSAEGKPGYHQAEGLDDAIRFVEHLRNQENVPDARIFRMQEVPIEFKTYVKVEVAGGDEASAPVGAPAAPAASAPAASAPAAVAPAAAQPAPAPAPAAAAAGPAAGRPSPAPVAQSPTVVDKHEDVVVDPMPVAPAGGGANNRFGRFNRG